MGRPILGRLTEVKKGGGGRGWRGLAAAEQAGGWTIPLRKVGKRRARTVEVGGVEVMDADGRVDGGGWQAAE